MQNDIIEIILAYIDENITDNIDVEMIALKSGYSAYYFSRIFSKTIGISLIAYVTWRKLQFALHDISKGEKITEQLKFKKGKSFMIPHIIELTPFTVAGRINRQKIPNVKRTADIPAFDFNSKSDVHVLLDNTEKLFPKSKHCEIEMCYDFDENTGEFFYFAGRGVTHPDDLENILPDMVKYEINGLFAIFTTPPVSREIFEQTIRDTWIYILTDWLPNSEFEYDDTRKDFEYYDYRSHGWYFDGKKQGDIFIPIRQREEAKRKSQENCEKFWKEEFRFREQRK